MGVMDFLWNVGKYGVASLPGFLVLGDVVGYPVKVFESSMQPTLNENGEDWVFLNRWCVRNYEIQNGDVVVFTRPDKPKERYIKRVIANEQECVRNLDGEVVSIPKGHCWVEGDNAKHSIDSNDFGPLAKGLIFAKATHVLWPPSRWRKLNCEPNASRRPIRCPVIN